MCGPFSLKLENWLNNGLEFISDPHSSQGLGKLEHTWAKPINGSKSVRLRSPDLPPGRIFMKRTRGIRFFGSRGRWEPNWGILSLGGHVCYSLPSLGPRGPRPGARGGGRRAGFLLKGRGFVGPARLRRGGRCAHPPPRANGFETVTHI